MQAASYFIARRASVGIGVWRVGFRAGFVDGGGMG